MAQSVKRLTSGHDFKFVSSSPSSGSVLTAWSLEPASDSLFPSVSAPALLALCMCLSQEEINRREEGRKGEREGGRKTQV